MEKVRMRDVNKGDFIRRKPEAKDTYIKGNYDRSKKDYSCTSFWDINKEIFIKPTTYVWIGFDF